ncbi:abc-2 type transporter [Colletotrichum incanum]|uniref:Abc-2 type transporter n=1 Tax=Colletotrichum incanum TaxID=1573173 RepID=A0A162N095_COLIC|nr:abc-2 type transporter [Colletotrichum incanum]
MEDRTATRGSYGTTTTRTTTTSSVTMNGEQRFSSEQDTRAHTGGFAPINTGKNGDSSDEELEAEAMASPMRDTQRDTMMIDEEDRRELQRIATTLSRHQSVASNGRPLSTHVSYGQELATSNDPALDPSSKSFDLSKWLQNFMREMQNEGIVVKNAGVAYKDLSVSGSGAALQLQQTVGDFLKAPLRIGEHFSFGKKEPKRILNSFDGILNSGELLIVLGRPGSGCSTLLKTMTGELQGLTLGEESVIHYNGIPQKKMMKEFKGETVYNQEVDKHFPHLTVGQTLEFAAAVRTPSHRLQGMTREEHHRKAAQVVMAVCGLSHTFNTKVGNDFVRGVSGGERKRVSIAEMMLAGSPMCAWDNSTRGLDSATALKFVQSLRLASDFAGSANAVAIYQASQAIYDLFDKAVVLYEGRQIYFGPAGAAKSYFERMGWDCPQRQTTGDFLTSVTNPSERKARPGMENQVPRTPEDFEAYWRQSPEFQALRQEIDQHTEDYPIDPNGQALAELRQLKNDRQAKHVRPKSPYIISMAMQVRLTTKRAYQRMWNDISATATAATLNIILALVIGSVFYGTPDATAGFYSKGSVLFQAILMNALTAISEINSLYDQRPIVEKHASYAFYHPASEAIAGVVADIPIKFVTATCFNLTLYFLAGLRREPGQFFLYFLITYISTFVMSAVFRTMAAITKTISQAMMLAGVMVLALVIYTGFVIRVPQMVDWFGWIRWINPIFYAFEILIANEFHGREFVCSEIIPAYTPLVGDSWICSAVGAIAGQRTVSGDAFIETNYQYYYSHVWRNFGILLAFLFFFMIIYFVATELNSSTTSTAEVLVFRRGHVPAHLQDGVNRSVTNEEMAVASKEQESDGNVKSIPPQKDIFTWRDVVYDIEIKGEPRRLLDNVSGWVKPGTLTALMGVSGAGKTTLLDVLAQRTTMGVITGDMFVNGKPLDASFQRKTGYVQQQDLHLSTATVRESLRFSAMLRQPKSVSKEEKYAFVEEVIDMLNMRDFADAVVGIPGEGLNVEQRKLLTIGVELAAKPKLLLFLDEPTSGLDSQSSWAICAFLRKLADSGQAVLCTVHQPSAILFQQFDRLLFLARGGKTVYFGDIGDNSRTLLNYFESHGARRCDDEENPAEYMLEIVNNGTNSKGEDWHSVWKSSNERHGVEAEIERIHLEKEHEEVAGSEDAGAHSEFAMPFTTQLMEVTTRVFQQYWRMPSYVFSKFILGIAAGLFIGFSFWKADGTMAGMQNVVFGVFMVITIFSTIVQQIQPHFVTQRALYEVRERPSKAYSWKAFMFASIIVEIPYQIITGILIWACFYYPIIGVQTSVRQVLVLLYAIQLFIYASSFAHMTIAAFPDAQTASGMVTLLVLMSLTFCGVLQSPSALPGFWIFMYRVSPFTYWVAGIVGTQLHGRPVTCSATETSIFNPPANQTCGEYLSDYLQKAPGQLQNPDATEQCRYCSLSNADQYLAGSNIFYDERWRNFGIVWAFVFFNIFIAVISYYLVRVKKWNTGASNKAKESKGKGTGAQ